MPRDAPGGTWPQPLPTLDSPALPELGTVASFEALAAHLPAGPYRQVLENRSGTVVPSSTALIENRICHAYWQEVAFACDRLSAFDRLAAREILGLRADIDALRILRRGRETGLSADQLLRLWPPLAQLVDPGRLRRVLRSAVPEAGLQQLLQRAVGGDGASAGYENALRRRLQRELRRNLVCAPFDISLPLSVLLLKELEIMDLEGLLAGLRYGLGPREIVPFFAGRKEG